MKQPPILEFNSREHTVLGKGWGLKLSAREYQSRAEKARRSFYKYVCTEGLFGKLRGTIYRWGVSYERVGCPHFGTPFPRGYPSWEASRSHAKDAWERKFKDAVKGLTGEYRAWEEAEDAKWRAEKTEEMDAYFRKKTKRNALQSPLMQMARAAQSLRALCPSKP